MREASTGRRMGPTCIALLRGINVGGQKKVAMADLRELLQSLGLDDVRSVLQSGNLVFRSAKRSTDQLERLLETECAKQLALRTDFIVRTVEEWRTVIAQNRFAKEAARDPSHLVVVCLKDAPPAKAVKALEAAIKGPESVCARGRQLYVVYPDGIGDSRLTLSLIEKKLGTRGTGRNWNTVMRLGDLAEEITGSA